VADTLFFELLTLGGISLALVFAAVWVISVRIGNYGLLDVAWSLSVALLAPVYALLGTGTPARRVAFAAIGAAWSLRLGIYILLRVLRAHPKEDARYRTLREKWRGPGAFLVFF